MNPAQQKKAALGELTQVVMPTQLNTILSDIDAMLASARQTIDQSLQQSSQLVDQSRQHLARINHALASEAVSASPHTLNDETTQAEPNQEQMLNAQVTYLEEQNTHMKQVYTEQELAAQQSAQAAQQAMETTIKNMEAQLMQQNQAFQSEVMQRSTETPEG
ncbi:MULTISPECIES: hypothetical protein [unclassified Pseudoalteromonas]|uniref:hypothetical protein n=1 Tax=unclassified Pseudoalteromonas TaxID=194690 RepID=UPI0020976C0B|nr:hypothetical protein [Pseudoalteromonas sp. XMcav2-N]MCO7189547.1 hypothetical protein [Pseudoalteromonas sp. XMcav2-N]